MAPGVREIDKEPVVSPRPKEMRVLVLGHVAHRNVLYAHLIYLDPMYTALQKVGYAPYHIAEAFKAPHQFKLWEECLDAHYASKGEVFGRKELDKLLGNFDILSLLLAIADIPCAIVVPEITYPNAKVILANRDVDIWMGSISCSAGVIFSWWSWPYLAPFEPTLVGPWWSFCECLSRYRLWFAISPVLRQRYLDHYTYVRSIVPKDNLLEFRSEDGWEPLCKFIGEKVPDEPYPRADDSDDFVELHKGLWWYAVMKW
ncbi:hypothetical protein MMC30_002181 [Trapelia coarctata]|nr:hypothetical protein [Trapelia coarctata]